MRGMPLPYELQAKGVPEVEAFVSSASEANCKKEGSFASNEPISVLDTRRSPSPSTSTSTLSSSFGGKSGAGGGDDSTDNIPNPVALSGCNLQQNWDGALPPPPPSCMLATNGSCTVASGGLKEEWAAELQPISAGLEVGSGTFERYGLGLEDWECLLSESAVFPAQDQTILRWISGELDDPSLSLKKLLQGGSPSEINGTAEFSVKNQSYGFHSSVPGGAANGNIIQSISSSLAVSGSVVSVTNNNEKIGAFPNSNSLGLYNSCNSQEPNIFASSSNMPFPSGVTSLPKQHSSEISEPGTQIFNPHVMISQAQLHPILNSNMVFPSSAGTQKEKHQFQPQPKRQNHGVTTSNTQVQEIPFPDEGHEFLRRKQLELHQLQQPHIVLSQQLNLLHSQHPQQKPLVVPKQEVVGVGVRNHQQQLQRPMYDLLCEAAELILARNFSHAQLILARLNQQLSSILKPYQRAAFYFKEALQLLLLMPSPPTSLLPKIPTPFDGMFKMGAYKVLSEVSPLIQFMNFTSNQVLLEALGNARHIHIIDFDIGFGAQWASFMQELQRKNGVAPSLKITAFASPSTHHPVEIGLMHGNLTQFANDIGVSFELEVVNFDSFDPNSYSTSSSQSSKNEFVAVNFPMWSTSSQLHSIPSLLRFIRQLSPKVVVSLDLGCELIELPLSDHLRHALQYYEVLFDSIDAANVTLDTANRIERFLFQPQIESIILGRLYSPHEMPALKTLFASAGFLPMAFSNFAQTQAECLVNRTQVRGFHLEKLEVSLVLCWQCKKLVAATAWRC